MNISDFTLPFSRLFGTKCEKCTRSFGASDFVMRAKNKIFHLECFRCVACDKQLVPGDEFALRPEGLFCKEDHANNSDLNPVPDSNREENNNNDDHAEDLEDDEDQSQDGDKDLDRLDRFADSGKTYFHLTLHFLTTTRTISSLKGSKKNIQVIEFLKMIGDPDLDRSFTIADLLSDLFNCTLVIKVVFSSQI